MQAEEQWNLKAGQEDEQTDNPCLLGVRSKELVQQWLRSNCRTLERMKQGAKIEKDMMSEETRAVEW